MGCCHSKPTRGSHHHHQQPIPLPPDVNGAASASFASSPNEVKLQGAALDGKSSDGLVVENNNLATSQVSPSVGVDALDGKTKQPSQVSTIGIQTETWFPQDPSGKMPLLNGSPRSAVLVKNEDRGLENLGFQGSSTSLIQEARGGDTSPTPMIAGLDERQKNLVENTWKTLEKNTELYGSMMFAKLTTDFPDIGKLFPFGGKNLTYGQLLVDPDVRSHGKRVIETVGSVVEDLDDMELVIPILEDLGQRHNSYNAKKTHIKAVGVALLHTIEQALGAGFTPEVKAAWIAVFDIVSDTMSTKLSDGPLSTREHELVRKTWGVLALDTEQHGAAMFAKLITAHPAVARLFPFGKDLSYSQLLENHILRAHGKRVMETIGQAVGSLDDLDILVPILRDLARRHVGYSVNRQHFEPVGEALIHAIREGLGRSFSEEVEKAWLAVFKLVVDTMSDMLPEGPKEIMSATHKRLLQDTWKKLSRDPERHGASMFAKLTTSHPDIGKVFPFGGKGLSYDQLLRNHDVKTHGRRVMETVGQAVNGLDDLDLLLPTLQHLAKRHAGYNVQTRYFGPTGEAFLHAVKLGLGPSSFTNDVGDAWAALFKVVTDVMSDVVPDGPITSTQRSLVQTSWKIIAKDHEGHGAVLFTKLITDNPNVGKLFPFGSMNLSFAQLLANKDLRAHGMRIMETIGVAVSGLDDLELLVPILQDLAKRHVGYSVTKQHFKPVGAALIHALGEGLGSGFTPELEAAWSAVYTVVADTMSAQLPAGGLTTEQKNLIKGSWRIVAPEKAKCGAVMFAKLVTEHPEVGRLFPFGRRNQSFQSLLIDDKVKAHGLRVMQTIGDAIRVLDNLDKLLPVLRDLGKKHIAYGVTKEHFAHVGKALLNTLNETLGNSFNDNTKNAWLTFWQLIEDTMSEEFVAVPDDGPLTKSQKEIVQRTWMMLSSDPGRHGAVMFARLVTDHPDVGRLFPFGKRGLTYHELLWNDKVKAHGKRVMQTIGHAVDGLDDLDVLVPTLQDLARRHIEYDVNKKHFEPVGEALIYAVEKGIGNTFNKETKAAWVAVFDLIVNTMSEILPDAVEEHGPLTREQKRLVQTTWKKLATNPTKHGSVMFAKLTTDNPDVGNMFPFGGKNLSYQQLLKDPQVHAHGKRVMETVGTAVEGLDDLNLLVPILRELGTRHIGYKVTKQHFQPVGAALVHAIKVGLGSSFSPDIQSAWVDVFQVVVDAMSDVLPDSGPLTSAQKELVKKTWQVLAPNPAKHGAVMFAKLTTDNPDVGNLFPFGGKNLSYQQLLKDPQVHAHGKRVMETVGTAVEGLDDIDLLVPILRELGTRHIGYKVTKQHFEPVGAALVHAIKEGLGSSFSPDIQSAWVAVFQLVVDTMSDVFPDSGPLTTAQKELVKKTWQVLAPNPAKHGAVMFAKLTTDNPDVGSLFPFGGKNLSYQQLLKDPQVHAHGKRVMETVGTAVEGLDDLDLLVPILRELGTRHIGYKVTKQQFQPVGAALVHAIKEGLGSSFSPDIQSAWVAVFQLVVDAMSDVLPDSGPLTSAQKELVKKTWQVLAPNPAKHGAVMFAKLLTKHPAVGKLFPFGRDNLSYHQLLKHVQVQAHGQKVMETVGHAVNGLDDLDLLVPILHDLGGRHVAYSVNRQQFEPVGEVLLETVKEALGDSFTDEVTLAWTAVFKLVSDTMSEAMNEGPITSEHKRVVQETWAKLAGDPSKHGATMFAKLVTDYPAVRNLFPFGAKGLSYDQLLVDSTVRAHGTRVMQTVGTAVDGLDDLDLLVPILQELATRHIAYGVTKQHFSPVVASLMHAVRQGLGRECNNDVEKAWLAVLQVVVDTMSAKLPDGILNDAKKNLVRETWAILSKNPEQHGAVMFAKLVTDNPTVGKLFPFGKKNLSYDQLLADSEAKAHGRRVMETVGHAVSGLDDLDLLVPILQELATRHNQYGATKKDFKPVGKALLHAIDKGLGKRFTPEVADAWGTVFTLITDTMSKMLPDNAGATLREETKRLVRESWKMLSTDPGKHGAVMFARLTTQNPIVGRLFQFGEKNLSYGQLLANPAVRSHGSRVMATIGHAIDTLDNLDVLVPVLKDLALRHTEYRVTKIHFEPVGQALLYVIKEGLGKSFTSEVKDAWSTVFQLISETMTEVLPEGPISPNHLEVLKRTWKVLGQNPEQYGAVVFAKLASEHPLVASLFPFGGKGLSYDNFLQDEDVKKHGRQFMGTVGNAIDNLENHEILVPMLEDLAKRHTGYGVTRQHLPVAGEALMYAIKEALGEGFTDDIQQAWESVFQLVVDIMSAKLPDGKKMTGVEAMTRKQRELVRSTWDLMSSAPDKHGAVMFAKLVSDNPKVGRLFPFGKKKHPYKKLLNENEVISHGERFMNTLGQVVGGLEDPEFLVPMLHQLAVRHSGYGVTKEHFQAAKSSLMFALKQGLGKSVFSSEVQEAWTAAYQFIEDNMCEKL